MRDRAARLTKAVEFIPDDATSAQFDVQLAHDAVILAVGRHVGQLETIYTPDGPMAILHGKDFYEDIGHKGGERTSRSHGKEFYQEIGHKGGQRVRELIKEGKKTEEG